MNAKSLFPVLYCALIACGGSSSGEDQSEQDDNLAEMAARCDAAPLPLEMIPPSGNFFLLEHRQTPCDLPQPDERVVVRNTSNEAVRLETLQISSKFSATAKLPAELAPGERLPLDLRYNGSGEEANATLIVANARGCAAFHFVGMPINVSEGYSTFSPYVVDFGSIRAGEVSAAQTLTIVGSSSPEGSSSIHGFQTVPKEAFELVDPPESVDFTPCGQVELRVRFHAPSASPGFVSGSLFWESHTVLDGTEYVAMIGADLIGDAE